MVAMNRQVVLHYDDGPGWPSHTREKERAYRQGFVEEARRVLRAWVDPDDDAFDPWAEVATAERTRRRVRDRLGCHPGYEVPAARARGRHHALEFVTQAWNEVADLDAFDRLIMPAWLMAVERWAARPIRMQTISPPPRPQDIEGAEAVRQSLTGARHQCGDDPAAPTETSAPPHRRLKLTRADQIEMRPPAWLLRGMLERDTFALIFGDPGTGKSFLAIDWACRVATGTPWRGHGVTGGPVVYVAGEGQQGFGRRIRAWSEHHGVKLDGAPLFVAPAVAIPEPSQLGELAVAIDVGEPPVMIVLDTLARTFGGGDENSTQDMSRFVSACDRLRRRYGCTILVVHHMGHADKSRARGAIALKAALDAEYRLADGEAGLKLTATKMKDAETPPPLGLELVSVDLPGLVDDYGNLVTSAAVEVIDADTGAIESAVKAASNKRGHWQRLGLEIAHRLVADGEDGIATVKDWHEACDAAGMRQSTRYDVLAKLRERGVVTVDGEALRAP